MKRFALLAGVLLSACGDDNKAAPDAPVQTGSDGGDTPASLESIKHVVVIYAENRGFDNMYGTFPGANGLPSTVPVQLDRDGSVLAKLPRAWGGVTAAGFTPAIPEASSDNLAN
ncbi:MAG: alkaline phosphatase family protein, partial [Kofleriaceae bacterium]